MWEIAAGALDIAGNLYGQHQAAKEQKRNTQGAIDYLNGARSVNVAGFERARRFAGDATARLEQGALDALAALDDGFAMEVRRVLESAAQQSAGLTQDLVGRGLYGSTAALNFQRALNQDTQRAVAETTAAFSGARSGVIMQGAQSVAGGLGNQASVEISRAGALGNINAQQASILAGAPVPVMNPLEGIGQLGAAYQSSQNNQALITAIQGIGR